MFFYNNLEKNIATTTHGLRGDPPDASNRRLEEGSEPRRGTPDSARPFGNSSLRTLHSPVQLGHRENTIHKVMPRIGHGA